jgi:hypothetical protein
MTGPQFGIVHFDPGGALRPIEASNDHTMPPWDLFMSALSADLQESPPQAR